EEAKNLASVYGSQGVKTYWDGVSLFAAPDGSSEVLATAAAGKEYEVISNDGSWVAVQMDDVTVAYVPAEDVMETTILDRAVSTGDAYGDVSSYSDSTGYDDGSSYTDSSYDTSYDDGSSYTDSSYDTSYDDGSSYTDSSYDTSYDDGSSYTDSSSDNNTSYEDNSGSSSTTDTSASTASSSDRELLAGLIYCEAGNQSREGKVAVGAVVMNRVASSSFAGTIKDVVYESGQFSPAGSGWLDSVIANGAIPSSCYEAADAALAGENPIGSAMYFNTGSGRGVKIGAHQFY
ncbi:MAG: cell wall hydrolase, partial [Lachnospiraceae bacterium]